MQEVSDMAVRLDETGYWSEVKLDIVLKYARAYSKIMNSTTFNFFIDLDGRKVKLLGELAADRPNVDVYQGDCNPILLDKVLPAIRFDHFKRALCLLDSYGRIGKG
jgi:hypothetical protein